jgi:hypothetical protein
MVSRNSSPCGSSTTDFANGDTVTNGSMEIRWDLPSRIAFVRYVPGAVLTAADGAVLVDALSVWIGTTGEAFAVLADGKGLGGTSAPYRAHVSRFFRQHRDTARIALINLGPVIRIVVDMFRLGTGVQLKSFGDEIAARSWLRMEGIAA